MFCRGAVFTVGEIWISQRIDPADNLPITTGARTFVGCCARLYPTGTLPQSAGFHASLRLLR